MDGTLKSFTDPAETSAPALNIGGNLGNRGAVAQTDDRRPGGSGPEMLDEVFVIGLGSSANPWCVRMLNLFESPGRPIKSAPRITTGGKPGPPVADVFEVAGRQKALSQIVPARRARAFTDDPIGSGNDVGCDPAQPRVIAREPIMFGQCPQDPSVVLVIPARFIAGGSVQDAFFGIEIA